MSSHKTATISERITSSPLSQADWVRVEAIHSLLIPGDSMVCSLVGKVVEIAPGEDRLALGDRVIALASPAPTVMLAIGGCLRISESDVVTEETAFWALALTLIPGLRLGRLEIGERVLIIGFDLVGQILVDMAWLAGAGDSIAFDPMYAGSDSHSIQSGSEDGPRWIVDPAELETLVPADSIDLLIDASGDPALLQSSLGRVRDAGRVLMVRPYHPAQSDFSIYPHLHKRSLKLVGYQLPTALEDLRPDNGQHLDHLDRDIDFVRHLFQSRCLTSSAWRTKRLQSPEPDALRRLIGSAKGNALLIEW